MIMVDVIHSTSKNWRIINEYTQVVKCNLPFKNVCCIKLYIYIYIGGKNEGSNDDSKHFIDNHSSLDINQCKLF